MIFTVKFSRVGQIHVGLIRVKQRKYLKLREIRALNRVNRLSSEEHTNDHLKIDR